MSCCDRDGTTQDLVCSRAAWLLWCAPAVLVFAGALSPSLRPALWIPAFGVMGVSCLYNVRRCRRLHCHITGPLFLGGAIATALNAYGVVTIGWVCILITMIGGTAIGYGLERVRGRYVAG